jgi:AraC-like DNA-binding protein
MYWWDQRIPGLSLMRADFTSHDYSTHTHDAFVIAVTEIGGARIRSRGVIEAAGPSQLFVSNPGEPQSSTMGDSERWTYRSLYLTQPAVDFVGRLLGIEAMPHFRTNMIVDADLVERFHSLHCALEEGRDRFRGQELLVRAFSLLARHGSGRPRVHSVPRDSAAVRKIIDMMRSRHAERLLLEDLAGACGLTVFQLIGAFRRTIGTTPHVVLTHIRVNAACWHLRHGTPIAEAAIAAGFADQSALTKNFKRAYGMTPLQYAKAAGQAGAVR